MGNSLLEFVKSSTFVSDGKPATNVIAHAPVNHILDFCIQTVELSKAKELPPESNILTHSASIPLGGGRFPCGALDCRLEQIDQLAQFAALYSEKVYVKNFFSDHLLHIDKPGRVNETALKQAFADDLQIFFRVVPLIKAGIVVPITPPHYCSHCLLKKDFGSESKRRMSNAFRDLATRIRNDVRVSVTKDHGTYRMLMDGSNLVFDHPTVLRVKKIPPFLVSHPELLARVKSGKSVTLTKQVLRNSKISEYLASELMESIVFELTLSQCLNTSFLINREIDRDFLRFLTVDRQVRELDGVIEKNLTAMLPFLRQVEPSDLLRLRQADAESFVLFRNAIRKMVSEYSKDTGTSLTQKDAKSIYGDILEPELARLTKKLEKAKKSLLRSTVSTITGWTAALSVGAYTGFVTGGIVQAAAALGLTKVLADITSKAVVESDVHAAIRDEELYFLWKVKRMSDH